MSFLPAGKKIPDGVLVLGSGVKIALEVETFYKQHTEWKCIVYKYKRDMNHGIYEFSD